MLEKLVGFLSLTTLRSWIGEIEKFEKLVVFLSLTTLRSWIGEIEKFEKLVVFTSHKTSCRSAIPRMVKDS